MNENYMYHLLYRGQLASKKLTLGGAKKLARRQAKEKGWALSDMRVVLVPPTTLLQGVN